MAWQIVILILSLVCLWFAANVVVDTVSMLSKRFHVSEFWVSFFVLGLAMSAPEVAVGINSIMLDLPEILIGDELGSSVGIFLLIIPILAVLTGGVSLKDKVTNAKLKMAFGMVMLPFLLIVDGRFSKFDSLLSILVYVFLMIYFAMTAKRESFGQTFRDEIDLRKSSFSLEVAELIFGGLVIFLAGNAMVESFKGIVDEVGGSYFALSLLLMSMITSMPEILVVIKSVMSGKKETAFGGYLGSAVANSFVLAVLSLIYGEIQIERQIYFSWLFGLFSVGLVMLYLFIKSKDDLSRREGIVLIMFYVAVVVLTTSM
jgi:cation:H+ antiporter